MERTYWIMWDDRKIGTAQLTRQGMYHRIRCEIQPVVPVPCYAVMRCEKQNFELGIFVPDEYGLSLTTRIPVKAVEKSKVSFYVYTGTSISVWDYYVVEDDKPLQCLARIKQARFTIENGKAGLKIPKITDQSEDRRDSGRNP